MPKKKIFVTRQIPDEGIIFLKKKGLQVKVSKQDKPISRRDLLAGVKGCDALLSILTDTIDAKVMDEGLPSLKVIANYAVGYNNIDLDGAKERGIIVTNTPGDEINNSVAEHTFALILSVAHRIVETDKFTRAGKYRSWGPELLLGTDVSGKTLGIIGFGRIGQAVAQKAYGGFGMNVLYSGPSRKAADEKQSKARYVSQSELLKKSDFVTLHVPLLPSTQHLISTKELKQMKKTAFLINTSRGPVVDELALLKALDKKDIAGAGLDVYECEPLIDCNPKDTYELRALDNVILTPHTASATVETRQAMSLRAAKNIVAALSGKRPPNKVV